jgi:hypothetical protein
MRAKYIVSVKKFLESYQRIGWRQQTSKSGKYYIFSSPHDEDLWMRLPITEESIDYAYYQEKNLNILLYALNLPEEESYRDELTSQLKEYNYKLLNRIIGKSGKINSTIPYELANIVPEKNIEAFRHFYQTRSKDKKSIPIEKFELNHTEVGSFVIPISIAVEDDKNSSLLPIQNSVNSLLHKYLDAVDTLTRIPRTSALQFADRVIDESIDSKIVKDFFGNEQSIARYTQKYSNDIDQVLIGSKGSVLLDYGLEQDQRQFREVDISRVGILDEEFIKTLEEREIQADNTKLEHYDAKIDVIIDRIDRAGKVHFTVTGIENDTLDKDFKAYASELPKTKLDIFAELFKLSGTTTIRGDVFKNKGKTGKINVDNIGERSSKQQNIDLFEGLS